MKVLQHWTNGNSAAGACGTAAVWRAVRGGKLRRRHVEGNLGRGYLENLSFQRSTAVFSPRGVGAGATMAHLLVKCEIWTSTKRARFVPDRRVNKIRLGPNLAGADGKSGIRTPCTESSKKSKRESSRQNPKQHLDLRNSNETHVDHSQRCAGGDGVSDDDDNIGSQGSHFPGGFNSSGARCRRWTRCCRPRLIRG